MLLVRGVHNGRAADFSNLLPVAVEGPATDLVRPDDVLDEKDPSVEPDAELVKLLNVLQQVVVGGARVGILVVVSVDEQFDHRLLGGAHKNE
jgi:hypothetical protein